jgi:hypothetical protein
VHNLIAGEAGHVSVSAAADIATKPSASVRRIRAAALALASDTLRSGAVYRVYASLGVWVGKGVSELVEADPRLLISY